VHRYFVTGTDTDVGKTRVTAALAACLRIAGETPTIVKLVQTGLRAGQPGDAADAGRLAKVRHVELARFEKAADPWSAAIAQAAPTVRAEELTHVVDGIKGAVVAEGAGGLAVPLNPSQNFAVVAALAKLRVILVVGLRLGCINHALLTLALCEQMKIPVAGGVLVNRWNYADAAYATDVRRALQGKIEILGILPFDTDEPAAVKEAAELFVPLL
jgi:dethiobiotin synthetase